VNWMWVALVLGLVVSLEIFALLWGIYVRPQEQELKYQQMAMKDLHESVNESTLIKEPVEWPSGDQ